MSSLSVSASGDVGLYGDPSGMQPYFNISVGRREGALLETFKVNTCAREPFLLVERFVCSVRL